MIFNPHSGGGNWGHVSFWELYTRLVSDPNTIQNVKLLSFDHQMDGEVLNFATSQCINQSENQSQQQKKKKSYSQVFIFSDAAYASCCHQCQRWDLMLNLKSILKWSFVRHSFLDFCSFLLIVLIAVVCLNCVHKTLLVWQCVWCCGVFFREICFDLFCFYS